MAKSTYEVLKCSAGAENLKDALNGILDDELEVISVLPDHGGTFLGLAGSGETYGYLIVLRRAA
jgi:hypothetical protein